MTELPLLDPHKTRCGPVASSKRTLTRAVVLVAVHAVILAHVLHWQLTGSTLTPVEPSEAASTLELGYVNAGFVLFALLILSTLIFGRFFCGWACHLVAYQDLCAWILTKAGLKPRPVRSRLLVLVPIWVALDMFVFPSLPWRVSLFPTPVIESVVKTPPGFRGFEWTTEDLWERFPTLGVTLLTFAIDGFLLVWWFGAKGFCTYGCPYGAVFGAADRLAPGKIRVNDACEGCGHCTAVCTSNVRVHDEVRRYGAVVDPGCMKCLDCVNVCPKDALSFGFGAPRPALVRGKSRPKRTFDFSLVEELAMAAVFVVAMFAFRGLYDRVPFLLAVGLAAMAALASILAVRLVSRPNVLFQHLTLKASGKWTPAGAAGALLLTAFLAFTAHSAFIQANVRLGESWMRVASLEPPASPRRVEARDAAARALTTADAWSLARSSKLEFDLASIAFNRGDAAETARRLRAAVDVNPRNGNAWLRLVDLKRATGALDGARAVAAEARAANPHNSRLAKALDAVFGEPRVK